jgi:AraC-like DNA-binding protein
VKNTGYSLRQYLIRYRINAAFNLLQTTDMSITDISLKVGFSDINYFSRCFKKILGVRPRECQIK